MLKSCSFCGRIHDRNYQCPSKPYSKKFNFSEADKFRNRTKWKKKSMEIRKRDKGLCVVCFRKLYNTQQQYTFDTIEVHHIIPLHEDLKRGFDNHNLLTVCKYHHVMCEPGGEIPRNVQQDIAKEQEQLNEI